MFPGDPDSQGLVVPLTKSVKKYSSTTTVVIKDSKTCLAEQKQFSIINNEDVAGNGKLLINLVALV